METVKTSEVLESEIMEDARAKARRIREAADRECQAIRAQAEAHREEEIRRLEASRDARIAILRQELTASLPLDSMRLRLAFLQGAVHGAMTRLFDSLSAADRARIIGSQLARAAWAFAGSKVRGWCAGMSEEQARVIIRNSLPRVSTEEMKQLAGDAAAETGIGIILETADGGTRFRGSLAELSGFLLEEYREELATALFGKDVHQ
jgi:vacuolar-type H+-ATPase subunit E/Vma4